MIVTICLLSFDPVGLQGIDGTALNGIVVLYLGPETMMPLASALAGIVGAVLIFWQRLVAWSRKLIRSLGEAFSSKKSVKAKKTVGQGGASR